MQPRKRERCELSRVTKRKSHREGTPTIEATHRDIYGPESHAPKPARPKLACVGIPHVLDSRTPGKRTAVSKHNARAPLAVKRVRRRRPALGSRKPGVAGRRTRPREPSSVCTDRVDGHAAWRANVQISEHAKTRRAPRLVADCERRQPYARGMHARAAPWRRCRGLHSFVPVTHASPPR